MMSLSIQATWLRGNIRSKLSRISKAKFKSIELTENDLIDAKEDGEDLKALLFEYGLRLSIFEISSNLQGINDNPDKETIKKIDLKFEAAKSLGSKLILLKSTNLKKNYLDCSSIERALNYIALRASHFRVRVAYMSIPTDVSIGNLDPAIKIIESIGSPYLGLAINSRYTLSNGSRPSELRDVPIHRIFHVQLCDGYVQQPASEEQSNHSDMLPGQGNLNLAGFVKVIAASGYKGNWSLAKIDSKKAKKSFIDNAYDAYRALVNLLDEVERTDPQIKFETPNMPARVYTSGVEFLEFSVDDESHYQITQILSSLCFRMERKHISKAVELWRQGSVNIVLNNEKKGFSRSSFLEHGPSLCAIGLRVRDSADTVERASALGASLFSQAVGSSELEIPAINGVGESLVYFIDEQSDLHRVWDIEFNPVTKSEAVQPCGVRRIDHIAQTMKFDEMQSWLLYYISTFEMEKKPVVDVIDPSGVIYSQVLESPEGEVRLNLNGADNSETFASKFLTSRFGAGTQHIALLSDDIFETSKILEASRFERLQMPDGYYNDLKQKYGLAEDFVNKLQASNILYTKNNGEYFQIYSAPIFDGFFFEIVERRDQYQGYGSRNASARLAAQSNYKQADRTAYV